MTCEAPLVLLVEDDAGIRRVTHAILSACQYQVIEAGNGATALAEVSHRHPDVVLLDLGLPDMSGLDVIHRLRDLQSAPIIVFSAGGLQDDRIAAIEAGASDYFSKPFVIGELLSRLRSVLNVDNQDDVKSESRFTCGDLDIDLLEQRVTVGGRNMDLTEYEFRLLTIFVKNSGRLLTYRNLIREVWGTQESSDQAALQCVVAQLRRKLEPDPTRPRHVLAELGIGYRFRSF